MIEHTHTEHKPGLGKIRITITANKEDIIPGWTYERTIKTELYNINIILKIENEHDPKKTKMPLLQ